MSNTTFVAELKARADIYDIVSESVRLRKSGVNWLGLCPFHSEKTPSFTVNPSKQIFHCFGCGAGGDVISFVTKRENMTFREALEVLAARYGMEIPRHDPQKAERRDQLLQLVTEAESLFRRHLRDDSEAVRYLKKRGLDEATVSAFSIGSAPDEWRFLLNALLAKKYSAELMAQAGLVTRGKNQSFYDTFRGRIIFPIKNLYGKTIAFGGRAIKDEQVPKYLNSPETPLYNKSEVLYGLDVAKETIKSEGFAFITEGYLDTISCHQFGFLNTVATLGTALTPGHCRLLKRFTEKVILVFDGDNAGRKAARKALRLLLAAGLDPKALVLPDGLDPDGYLRARGAEAFHALFLQAEPMVEFLIAGAIRQGEGAEGLTTATEALSIIAEIPNAIIRGVTLKSLSERLGVNETFLMEELGKVMKTTSNYRRQVKEPAKIAADSSLSKPDPSSKKIAEVEKLLVATALEDTGRIKRLLESITGEEEYFENEHLRKIFVTLKRFMESGRPWSQDEFMLELPEGACRSVFTELTVQRAFDEEDADKVFEESLGRIRERITLSSHKGLIRQIGELNQDAMNLFLEEQRRLKARRNPDR